MDPFERWKVNVEMMNAIALSQGFVYLTVLQPLVGYGSYKAEPQLLKKATKSGHDKEYYRKVQTFLTKATEFCRSAAYCIDLSHLFDEKTGLYFDVAHP